MTKASFYKLVAMLRPYVKKQDTRFRPAVPADERVAIALFRLTTNMYYRNIEDQFGRGHATVVDATNAVVAAICRLKATFIRWPQRDELVDIINGFHEISKFPMVAGALDGSHIPVLCPADQRNDYHCYKGFYSINLQAVADNRCRFTYVFTGFPGRAHDARVFGCSSLYLQGQNGTLFDDIHTTFDGTDISPLLVADNAYPLLPWVMKAFPDSDHITAAEIEFNTCINTARNVAERAFGILKARFRCLRKQLDMEVLSAPDFMLACCCLHNFCIENQETVLVEWEDEARLDEEELIRRFRDNRDRIRAEAFPIFDFPPAGIANARMIQNVIKNFLIRAME